MLLEVGIFILVIAFILEYFDATLGMGYGTALTPVLLIIGLEPLQIVPAVLISAIVAGLFASLAHQKVGNVNFRKPRIHKIVMMLAACSIIGAVAAVFIAVNISTFYLTLYIGLLVTAMGLLILWKRKAKTSFSKGKMLVLGIVAAFNKGISGGGYGPLVTSGQILSGVDGKHAIGITTLAEGLTCIVAAGLFIFMETPIIDWELAAILTLGAALSVPFSALTVKKIKIEGMTTLIGGATVLLGLVTLIELFI